MTVKMKTLTALLLSLLLVLSFTACSESGNSAPSWSDAKYTEDTALGEGEKTFEFQVKCEEDSVTFTVSTDKEILGEALLENELIAGDEGAYGLYVKYVNGIYADYDVNGYYWSFTKNGETMMTGVDSEKIEAGAHYEMTCTK